MQKESFTAKRSRGRNFQDFSLTTLKTNFIRTKDTLKFILSSLKNGLFKNIIAGAIFLSLCYYCQRHFSFI